MGSSVRRKNYSVWINGKKKIRTEDITLTIGTKGRTAYAVLESASWAVSIQRFARAERNTKVLATFLGMKLVHEALTDAVDSGNELDRHQLLKFIDSYRYRQAIATF